MKADNDLFIIVHQKMIITDHAGAPLLLKRHELPAELAIYFLVGRVAETSYFITKLDSLENLAENYSAKTLRQLLGEVDEQLWLIIGKGVQLIEWYQTHQFCSRCGHSTVLSDQETACECTHCHYLLYPRINPCIMVLIQREAQILLARSSRHQASHYSLIAGFIEAGESVEEAIHREVFEEVGLRIQNLRYICSQSWPFPHSLMLGFVADYAAGDINIAPDEIADAQWFGFDDLSDLKLPEQGTLSRKLIDIWRSDR